MTMPLGRTLSRKNLLQYNTWDKTKQRKILTRWAKGPANCDRSHVHVAVVLIVIRCVGFKQAVCASACECLAIASWSLGDIDCWRSIIVFGRVKSVRASTCWAAAQIGTRPANLLPRIRDCRTVQEATGSRLTDVTRPHRRCSSPGPKSVVRDVGPQSVGTNPWAPIHGPESVDPQASEWLTRSQVRCSTMDPKRGLPIHGSPSMGRIPGPPNPWAPNPRAPIRRLSIRGLPIRGLQSVGPDIYSYGENTPEVRPGRLFLQGTNEEV